MQRIEQVFILSSKTIYYSCYNTLTRHFKIILIINIIYILYFYLSFINSCLELFYRFLIFMIYITIYIKFFINLIILPILKRDFEIRITYFYFSLVLFCILGILYFPFSILIRFVMPVMVSNITISFSTNFRGLSALF